MAAKSLRTNALQAALRILGSEQALSRRLQVPAADLARWLRGEAQPTETIFLRTVDLLAEHSARLSDEPSPLERPVPRATSNKF
jgi:hypothetical protein